MNTIDGMKTNDRFGKLTVIAVLNEKDTNYNRLVLCKCDCGNEVKVTVSHLLSGHTKSCGCAKRKIVNHAGEIYGKTIVLDEYARKNKTTKWKCRCGYCGKEFYATISSLKKGSVISCGCQNTARRKELVKDNIGFIDHTSLSAISSNRKLNKNSTTGVNGVSFDKDKQKYVAQIYFQRKNYFLGYYDSIAEAKEARKNAEEKIYKPFLEANKK